MEILNIENLRFTYPEREEAVLKDVSFGVNEGDFLLLCGASGSGKSTLLKLLIPEFAPYGSKEGNISIASDKKAGIVLQDIETQIVSDTVWHNLAFGLESMNLSVGEIRQKIAEIAEYFDISHLFHKNTFNLSGGEKQLLNLASVMVMEPDILLLDEPTSQLDPIAAGKFIDMLKRLNSEMNTTIIISEHRTDEIWDFADRILVLDEGRLAFDGNNKSIYEFPSDDAIDLPYFIKLFNRLNFEDHYPTTISECRNVLKNHIKSDFYKNDDKLSVENKIALKITDIYFRYEKNSPDVLKNMNFSANFGEVLTLFGGNGCGKTTLLKILSGINKPYCGKVEIYGKKVCVLPQNVKTVFTKDILSEDLSQITMDFKEICRKLGVMDLIDRNPYDLSGGEAQRAALAKILLLKPDILCLDEPTKGIDAKGKRALKEILDELKRKNVAVIIVSHDADFSAEVSDRCAFMFDGEIVSSGTPNQVFSKNKFYTTYASRISRNILKDAVTIDDIVQAYKKG